MLVFACETSCDETSLCLLENKTIVEHIIFSQEIHNKHGGVVPELASRSHLQKLQEMTIKLFEKTNIDPNKIDIFAATCGPGLIGSLLIGSTFTKSLSIHYNKPFIPVNHLEGHVLSTSFNNEIEYPHLVLLLTGGHTQVYLMINDMEIKLLGESVDDAIGEAFDKTAKLIGLGYPGGSEIERIAKQGNEDAVSLPKPLVNQNNFNFSFSGIKTHINLLIKKNKFNDNYVYDLCASFQKTMAEIISLKTIKGLKILNNENINIKSISVVGGVINNEYIRKKLANLCTENNIKIYYPTKEMMSDNAAMIAWACIKNYRKEKNDIFFKPQAKLSINEKL